MSQPAGPQLPGQTPPQPALTSLVGPRCPRADPTTAGTDQPVRAPSWGRPSRPCWWGCLSGRSGGIGALTQSLGNCGQCPGCSPAAGGWHTHRGRMRAKGLASFLWVTPASRGPGPAGCSLSWQPALSGPSCADWQPLPFRGPDHGGALHRPKPLPVLAPATRPQLPLW